MVAVHRDVRIPTAEPGVTLSGDLVLPDGDGTVPLLLAALPYRRDAIAMGGSSVERWFAERGYASLLIDFRGVGSSDGAQRPAFAADEADDAIAAIEWAVRQPWCDGSVGMWGHSYGAIMAMRTASRRPPGLRAIIAWQGPIDPELDFVHPGGARGALGPFGLWAMGCLFGQLLPPLDDFEDEAEQARWRHRLAAEPYLLDMVRHGPGDPVWRERRIDASAIEVPALCLAGWRDLFVDGMIRAYEQMSGPKQLIAGPWMHSSPQDSPFAPIDFANLALAWWDRWLRDRPTGVEDAPPARVYVQGAEPRWLAFDAWPPTGADRAENRVEDLSSWQVTAPDEPDAAVGALSGLWAFPAGTFGMPLDQHDDDARSLSYTSPPLDRPLLVSGRPRVALARPWSQVSVKLTDVDEAGRSTLICAAVAAKAPAEVTLAPTTYEVPAGHRLRVVIAPGDFPRVWPVEIDGDWPVAVGLTLPTPTAGRETTLPPPDPDDLAGLMELFAELTAGLEPPGRPVWSIGTDLLADTVSVRLGADGPTTMRPPHRKHLMRTTQNVVATANRAEPAAASITGTMSATVDTETGQHIEVDVEFTVTSSGVDAGGRVALDGETLLDRRWEAS